MTEDEKKTESPFFFQGACPVCSATVIMPHPVRLDRSKFVFMLCLDCMSYLAPNADGGMDPLTEERIQSFPEAVQKQLAHAKREAKSNVGRFSEADIDRMTASGRAELFADFMTGALGLAPRIMKLLQAADFEPTPQLAVGLMYVVALITDDMPKPVFLALLEACFNVARRNRAEKKDADHAAPAEQAKVGGP